MALPDGEGIELVEAMCGITKAPIIVLTGRDDDEFALETLRKGAEDYLTKQHLDHRTLTRVIRHSIERHRLRVELEQAQEQLVDAERVRVLVEIAGATAHEINQPLTALLIEMGMLQNKRADDEEVAGALGRCINLLDQVSEIVTSMRQARRYVTKDYAGGAHIIDLEAAGQENDDGNRSD